MVVDVRRRNIRREARILRLLATTTLVRLVELPDISASPSVFAYLPGNSGNRSVSSGNVITELSEA